jgi:hypothetical protein
MLSLLHTPAGLKKSRFWAVAEFGDEELHTVNIKHDLSITITTSYALSSNVVIMAL